MVQLKNNLNQCMECTLCKIVSKKVDEREIYNTLLYQSKNFQCVPGLGAFIEGYSLIISKSHVLNTGCFSLKIIKELEDFIQTVMIALKEVYKKNLIVFEHGPINNKMHAGSCIDHHHIHIFPIEMPKAPPIMVKNFVTHSSIYSMNSLRHFNKEGIPYIYFMSSTGDQYVFETPILPRQYVRQVLAKEIGKSQDWDWREKPFIENISSFVKIISGA